MTIDQLKKLAEPMTFQWKIQSFVKDKSGKKIGATVVAYIDSRDVQNRLDEVVGLNGWQNKFQECSNGVIGTIGIKCGDEWLWKSDIGTPGDFEKEKGAFSDAFKRAAVHWGVGRFLYDLPLLRVKLNDREKPVDDNNVEIKDLTKWATDKLNGRTIAEHVKELEQKDKTCPQCGKLHQGRYPKCIDCYKAGKK